MASFIEQLSFQQRLERFYNHYQPAKLSDVENLLTKVAGKEDRFNKLFSKLVEKYGEEPELTAEEISELQSQQLGAVELNEDEDEDVEEEDEADSFRERLIRFYEEYDESKLANIDALLAKTQGKPANEEKLIAKLVEKYGPEPEYDSEEEADPFKERLIRFYEKYDESRLSNIDALLAKTQGKPANEEKLIEKLIEKYGPEPVENEESEDEGEDDEEEEEDDEFAHLFRKVTYCPVDGFPPEYSEYLPTFDECLPWLLENCPELKLTTKKEKTVAEYVEERKANGLDVSGAASKTKQKRGGGAVPNKKKGKKLGEPEVTIELIRKNKKRFVTVVIGLETFEVKLKEAAKKLGKRFACGASVHKTASGVQCIEIQGDVIWDLPDVILKFFSNIPKELIFNVEGGSKTPACR